MEEEQPCEIWWRPFVPLEACPIHPLTPRCTRGASASKVTIYPISGLISIDDRQLFMCRVLQYPLRLIAPVDLLPPTKTEKELWHEVLSSVTHVALSHDEDQRQIFFTMFGNSFERNEAQPFGLWATLRPVPYRKRILRPLRTLAAAAVRGRSTEKAAAWACAGQPRLGDQIPSPAVQTVAENLDLMLLIILAVVAPRCQD
jgi:hypothetical protein